MKAVLGVVVVVLLVIVLWGHKRGSEAAKRWEAERDSMLGVEATKARIIDSLTVIQAQLAQRLAIHIQSDSSAIKRKYDKVKNALPVSPDSSVEFFTGRFNKGQ